MGEDLVSVVVPIYNVEKYLDKCLESIQRQSYKNIEVIMINDGSKDSSPIIAKKYEDADDRFKLYTKENGGLSSGRNYGMDLARGKYICFIDSDDFIGKNYIFSLIKSFDKNTDIVISDYVIYNSKNHKSYYHSKMLKEEVFIDTSDKQRLISYLLYGVYPVMPVWKNMYRLEFLRNNDIKFISERLIYAEDAAFHVEAYSKANKIKIINNIEFFHLVVPGSLSQSYRENYFEMQKNLYNCILDQLEKYYNSDFVKKYQKRFSSSIGASILNLSKCNFKKAKKNVEKILNDKFVCEYYKNNKEVIGNKRYVFLYKVGKLKSSVILVITSKIMILFNPIYRFFQRKKEFKMEDELR